ncbi:hypothetical protein DFP72DRAFT_1081858 [Ephemerocybe angulata]|uniref:Uncharacterized protein n=1 Tax=Ephemerocybe angulata TaxID=980116 RepID=A0A8H6H8R0_9AGAR|nr:hypothetical protein DFP72DRAFT_1081858 [Tulosesus angulatus]
MTRSFKTVYNSTTTSYGPCTTQPPRARQRRIFEANEARCCKKGRWPRKPPSYPHEDYAPHEASEHHPSSTAPMDSAYVKI